MAAKQLNYADYSVLLLEDDATCAFAVSRAIEGQFPNINVLCAEKIKEARLFIQNNKIHFYILDIHLPDGSGIDLLVDIKTHEHDAQVVMVTATPLPKYCKIANSVGVLQFIVKPFFPRQICNLLEDHLKKIHAQEQSRDGQENEEKPALFSGSLSGLTALDILQLKCLSGATQAVDFVMPNERARVYFQRGNIIHAQTLSASGVPALKAIIGSRGGEIIEIDDPPVCQATITEDWQSVLLQAVQAVDESRTVGA